MKEWKYVAKPSLQKPSLQVWWSNFGQEQNMICFSSLLEILFCCNILKSKFCSSVLRCWVASFQVGQASWLIDLFIFISYSSGSIIWKSGPTFYVPTFNSIYVVTSTLAIFPTKLFQILGQHEIIEIFVKILLLKMSKYCHLVNSFKPVSFILAHREDWNDDVKTLGPHDTPCSLVYPFVCDKKGSKASTFIHGLNEACQTFSVWWFPAFYIFVHPTEKGKV